MNFRTLITLSSMTSHLTSTIFKWPDIAAAISGGFQLPSILNLGLDLCSLQKHFSRINNNVIYKAAGFHSENAHTLEKR